ncbi:MAG TPA: DUF4383 domain-containing protein [Mycobacteriales bacterium]
MKLHEELPVDHKLARVYRLGAGLIGAFLLIFGILGFLRSAELVGPEGVQVLGLSSNGLLSGISVLVGLLLIVVAWIGGNLASTVNSVLGFLFLLNGLQGLALLRTSLNVFAFDVRNVIFSFVVGLALLIFGLYGRVSGGLTAENPYWRARHGLTNEEARREQERADRVEEAQARAEQARVESGHKPGDDKPPEPW